MDEDKAELTIHQRMIGILGELPAIGANQENKGQGFKFRGYADVLNALNPLLEQWGVFFMPTVIEQVTEERVTSKGNALYVTRVHVEYRFFGAKGDHVAGSLWGEGSDSGDKGTNKAMTGAMKYMLFQTFAIALDEITDADGQSPEDSRSSTTMADLQAARKADWGDKVLPEGWATFEAMDDAHEMFRVGMENLLAGDKERVKAYRAEHSYGWPMPKSEYDDCIEYVKNLPDPAAEAEGYAKA